MLRRPRTLSTVTSRFAVLGSPITHSKSPALHRAAISALGIDAEYASHDVHEGELRSFLATRTDDEIGFSLTMPLKHAVRELVVDECADSTLAGAVNTIVRGTSGWHGFNTDVWGAQTAIAQSIGTHSRSAIVLGGGATASSLTVALARIGVEHVTVALRDVSKAGALRSLAVRLGLGIDVVQLNGASLQADLLVNTLPGNVQLDASAIDDLDAGALFDVSYDPWPNALSREWTARGLPSSSGLLMLLWQAVRQARVFYGDGIDEPLPNEGVVITAMRSAVGL
ncbi:MAG: hypothetical protein RLZ72_473 [Actinomycetota bacterium]